MAKNGEIEELGQLISTAKAMVTRIETYANESEQSSQKANSESGFAYNAKINAEEHARAIAQLRGSADVDVAAVNAGKRSLDEIAQSAAVTKSKLEGDAQVIADIRVTVELSSTFAKNAEAEGKRNTAALNSSVGEAEALVVRLRERDAAVEKHLHSVEEHVISIDAFQTQASTGMQAITEMGTQITKYRNEADAASIEIEKVKQKNLKALQEVLDHEAELKRLVDEFVATAAKIEGLLPNATSAGLASAFRNQKARFKIPQIAWLSVFGLSIVGLLWAGLQVLNDASHVAVAGNTESWDSIFRHLMMKLPIVAPLVWLGIMAGRHYSIAARLQEEYAYKEAVSTAFEGYKREMNHISGRNKEAASPLIILCENVLSTLALRPGRIYEGKHDDITPLSSVTQGAKEVISSAADAVTKATDAVKKGLP